MRELNHLQLSSLADALCALESQGYVQSALIGTEEGEVYAAIDEAGDLCVFLAASDPEADQ